VVEERKHVSNMRMHPLIIPRVRRPRR
jgi:hypothetical protein